MPAKAGIEMGWSLTSDPAFVSLEKNSAHRDKSTARGRHRDAATAEVGDGAVVSRVQVLPRSFLVR